MFSLRFSSGWPAFAGDLAAATRAATDVLPPCTVAELFDTPFAQLGGWTPIECLRAGQVERVHAVIEGWRAP